MMDSKISQLPDVGTINADAYITLIQLSGLDETNYKANRAELVTWLTASIHALFSSTDPITYNSGTGAIGLAYNTTNLQITANELNTIQNIDTTSAPFFGSVFTAAWQLDDLVTVFKSDGSLQSNSNFVYNVSTGAFGVGVPKASLNSRINLVGTYRIGRYGTSTSVGTTTAANYIIAVTSTASPRTITLNTADNVSGRVYIIKDESGGASTNPITITPETGTIDGAASITISVDYGSVTVYSNSVNWFTI